MSVEIIGPFRGDYHYLSVNGCRLYDVHLLPSDKDDADWTITVDRRWTALVTTNEVKRWGYLLANAMAVSAGFTYHGPRSKPLNEHSVQFTELGGEDDNPPDHKLN